MLPQPPTSNIPPPPTPNNSEIDNALKEFEKNESSPTYAAIKYYKDTAEPKMVKGVIKLSGGAIKNQKQAEWLLFGFVVVAVGVSVWLFFFGGNNVKKVPPLTPEQRSYMETGHGL